MPWLKPQQRRPVCSCTLSWPLPPSFFIQHSSRTYHTFHQFPGWICSCTTCIVVSLGTIQKGCAALAPVSWYGLQSSKGQYQQEEVQDWASHLEYLQSILIDSDADGAPEESDLIRFFLERLKPLVKAQMEQRGRELDSWDELVEKAIDAEAKASLQPPSFIREMDQRCRRGNRPAHTTVAKSQASSTLDPQEEPSENAQTQDKPPNSSSHIPRSPKMARPPTRKLGRKRRGDNISSTSGPGKTPDLPPPPVSMSPTPLTSLPAEPARILVRLPVSTAIRRDTTRGIVPNPGRAQKPSNSLGDLCTDN